MCYIPPHPRPVSLLYVEHSSNHFLLAVCSVLNTKAYHSVCFLGTTVRARLLIIYYYILATLDFALWSIGNPHGLQAIKNIISNKDTAPGFSCTTISNSGTPNIYKQMALPWTPIQLPTPPHAWQTLKSAAALSSFWYTKITSMPSSLLCHKERNP